MCGIMAVYDREARPSEQMVRKGMDALRHRGPDSTGIWQSPDHFVTLGHTRLSIIDLTTGDQPLANEDGSIHVVVNGEFYDFERIRASLEARGHRFRTHSDSEILLHLYEDLGVACLEHLRGEFAFVLWDARQQLLFAARDRFGIKPLFWNQSGARLTFGSEAKALFAAGVPAAWDDTGFWQMFTVTMTQPRSLFRNVSAVPPGHYLLARNGDAALHKYWDFDFPHEDDMPPRRPDADIIEEFGAHLHDAVKLRLRADVPVGCYLSGGIDSCSVLGLMSKLASTRVHAFSIGFDHELYDEGPLAREMAAKTGAEFTAIPLHQSNLADHMSDSVWHSESMFVNGHCAAKFQLSREVRDAGFKVVLTGEGSDEVLAGYPFFRLDLSRHAPGAGTSQKNLAQTNTASSGLLLPSRPVDPVPALVDAIGFCPAFIETRKAGFDLTPGVFRLPATPDEMLGDLARRLDVAGQITGRHVLNRSLYVNNKTVLPNFILVGLGDRMEMAHSIEARLPFLDHHLVEYTRTMPIDFKIRNGIEKFVLRESMQPLLTERVYKREKHPFLSPPVLLSPGEKLHVLLQDTVRSKSMDRVPYFDQPAAIRLLETTEHLETREKIALEPALMMIMTACLLAERFGL